MSTSTDRARRPVEVGRAPAAPAHRWREPGEQTEQAEDTYDGMRSAAEMDALLQARVDEKPIRLACLFCDWSWEGTAGDGRPLQREHLEQQHPEKLEARKTRKRRKNSSLQGSGEKLGDTGINLSPHRARDTEQQAEAELIAEQRREAALAVEARREMVEY